jgi:hypothetical protein
MSERLFRGFINTRLQPGVIRNLIASRFNGFLCLEGKPLKRFGSFADCTGLKPGVNESRNLLMDVI